MLHSKTSTLKMKRQKKETENVVGIQRNPSTEIHWRHSGCCEIRLGREGAKHSLSCIISFICVASKIFSSFIVETH